MLLLEQVHSHLNVSTWSVSGPALPARHQRTSSCVACAESRACSYSAWDGHRLALFVLPVVTTHEIDDELQDRILPPSRQILPTECAQAHDVFNFSLPYVPGLICHCGLLNDTAQRSMRVFCIRRLNYVTQVRAGPATVGRPTEDHLERTGIRHLSLHTCSPPSEGDLLDEFA